MVAEGHAGVTVPTVLRIFGGRSALVGLGWDSLRDRIMAQRQAGQPGDIGGTITALYQHYEAMGDFVVRNLAEEHDLPELGEGPERGRHEHRRSMERQFAPLLTNVAEAERAVVIDGPGCRLRRLHMEAAAAGPRSQQARTPRHACAW